MADVVYVNFDTGERSPGGFRIREQPVTRELDGPVRIALERLVSVLEQHPKASAAELAQHMKTLFVGTGTGPACFFPVVYDLLVARTEGPKITTLVASVGAERVLPLLRASLS